MLTRVKTASDIAAMREGGHMLATVLKTMSKEAIPGRTPKDMSAIASKQLKELGGKPAFLGYEGYPDVICISVNNQVQHSIPDNRPFQAGDVVNFDFGVRHKGLVTDAGITVCVGGKPDADTARLIRGTQEALAAGVAVVTDGCRVGDISAAIERVLHKHNLGIVQELVGHGGRNNLSIDTQCR